MILSCPKCKARFLVPDNAIGLKGRDVRCGKCAHQWFAELPRVTLDDAPKAAAEAPKEEPQTAREKARAAARGAAPEKSAAPDFDKVMQQVVTEPPTLRPVPVGSALPVRRAGFPFKTALAACLLMAAAAVAGFADFAPERLGLAESHGMVFEGVQVHPGAADAGGHARYALAGSIVNASGEERRFPLVRLTLLDKNGVQLRHWWLEQRQEHIDAAEKVPFVIAGLDLPREDGLKLRLDMGNWFELALRPVE